MRDSTPRGAGHPDFGDAPPKPSRGSHGPIRILVADDEREVREALADLINEEPNLQLVGMAGDADEAIELADAARPDVGALEIPDPAHHGRRKPRRTVPADRASEEPPGGRIRGRVPVHPGAGPPDRDVVRRSRRGGAGQGAGANQRPRRPGLHGPTP